MRIYLFGAACRLVLVGMTTVSLAMTPDELNQRLAAGEKITVIDIRSQTLYARGHIPNAINIPAGLIPERQLPKLGMVVVYDDGLGRENAAAAVDQLNRKPGITAVDLTGGFAYWEMRRGQTTEASGLKPEHRNYITYRDLTNTAYREAILVDLRAPRPAPLAAESNAPAALTDLRAKFPWAMVVRSPFDAPAKPEEPAGGTERLPPLYILIDDANGQAEIMARIMRANGYTRVLILAGGEKILERDGRPGLQRQGPGRGLRP